MSRDTEKWCKVWRKTDLLFQKWWFGQFWCEHWDTLKIFTLIGSFCAKYITFDLKNYKELSSMALKGDEKFEEKLTYGLENDMRNVANFNQSTWKSQNGDYDGIL